MAARRAAIALTAGAVLAGCGQQGPDYALKTPPSTPGAAPIETPAPKRQKPLKARPGEKHPSQRDAERLRPVLEGWAQAIREGNPERAARYFAVPAIVAQSMTVELQTFEQVRKFNDELPCGAKLLEVQHDGRYVVGTFRLTERPGRSCATAGQLVRVAFVIRQRHFTEWRQVPDQPGAPPGPDEPEDAPPPGGPGAA